MGLLPTRITKNYKSGCGKDTTKITEASDPSLENSLSNDGSITTGSSLSTLKKDSCKKGSNVVM